MIASSAKHRSEQEYVRARSSLSTALISIKHRYISSLRKELERLQQPGSDTYERTVPGSNATRINASNASPPNLPAPTIPRRNQPLSGYESHQTRSPGGQQPVPTLGGPNPGDARPQEWTSSNSDKDFGTSPVNAMGAILTSNAPLPERSGESYGRSSVAFLMQEVNYPPNQRREPLGSSSGVRSVSGGLRLARKKLRRFADSSLHAQVALPPRKMAEKFLDSYFRSQHVFYPWIHSTTFRQEASALWTDEEDRTPSNSEDLPAPDIGLGGHHCPPAVFFGALNAVFALGCESSDLSSHEKDALSSMFFSRMKELIVHEILSGGSIAHVQTLLLAGQYLHSTQYPTQCWNYIGLACRIAIGLGLQSESPTGTKTQLEVEIRRRVWYGCLQMDMYVTSLRSPFD